MNAQQLREVTQQFYRGCQITNAVTREALKTEISLSQCSILQLCAEYRGRICTRQLLICLNLDELLVDELVIDMVAKGWLLRDKDLVKLTCRGRFMQRRVAANKMEIQRRIGEAFSPDEALLVRAINYYTA